MTGFRPSERSQQACEGPIQKIDVHDQILCPGGLHHPGKRRLRNGRHLPLSESCDRFPCHSLLDCLYPPLADIVSFGVAPAVLGFALGLQGMWDALILIYFVSCGISRLARFNATAEALSDGTGKVKYYEGTPIPASILLVLILGVAFWQGRIDQFLPFGSLRIGPWIFHPFTLLYAASGSAMISTIRIPKP
jgi:hypothetical protein